MAQLIQQFNPQDYDPSQSGGQFPVGVHDVKIKASDIKKVNNKDAGYVEFTGEILSGEHKGVSGVFRINQYSDSQEAAGYAHRQMSALCHVCGVLGVLANTEALHNKPFKIEVGLQKGEDAKAKGYTEVKKFYDAAGNEPRAGQAPQTGNAGNAGGFGANTGGFAGNGANQGGGFAQNNGGQGGGFGQQANGPQDQGAQQGGFGPQGNGGGQVGFGQQPNAGQQAGGFGQQGNGQGNGGGNWAPNGNQGGAGQTGGNGGGWGQQRS